MGCIKREGIPSNEMQMRDFDPFKNGIVNCHVPHHYNWATGFTTPPKDEGNKKYHDTITIGDKRANYHTYGD